MHDDRRRVVESYKLTGKSNAITFVVACGPTDTVSNTREHKDAFWADLDSAVSRVPSSDYLLVLIDANARTDVQIGEKDSKAIEAYRRDARVSDDSNGTSLFWFAGDNKLALVDTLVSVPKGCTSRTLNVNQLTDRKRFECTITQQPHTKLVRNDSVHLQQRTDANYNIVCARVRLSGRFAGNRKQRAPTGRKRIDEPSNYH